MGVMGAFVFAAQMINFTLPGMPGTSGHLGGGVLLAILLGPAAGIVTMAAILIVQCLLFQDGGLLALGCNIINMGVIPCLLGWGLYRAVLGRRPRRRLAAVPGRMDRLRGRRHRRRGDGAGRGRRQRRAAGAARPVPRRDDRRPPADRVLRRAPSPLRSSPTCARVRPELMGLEPADAPAAAAARLWGRGRVAVGHRPAAGRRGELVRVHPARGGWNGVISDIATGGGEGRPERFAGGCRGRPVADEMVADDRLQPARGAAGPVARRRTRTTHSRLAQSSGWGSLAGVLGTIVTLGVLYGLSRWMRKALLRNCTMTLTAPPDMLAAMHHHFIDRFAMGDSPDPSPRCAGEARWRCWPTPWC